jgi:hypothetical protein
MVLVLSPLARSFYTHSALVWTLLTPACIPVRPRSAAKLSCHDIFCESRLRSFRLGPAFRSTFPPRNILLPLYGASTPPSAKLPPLLVPDPELTHTAKRHF